MSKFAGDAILLTCASLTEQRVKKMVKEQEVTITGVLLFCFVLFLKRLCKLIYENKAPSSEEIL